MRPRPPPGPGHGHVHPRPDESKADCGGPRHCKACRDELVELFERGEHAHDLLAHQYLDPNHVLTDLLDAMRTQLLIVFANRLGGRVEVPVGELDGTGAWLLAMVVDQEAGVFTFETARKS